jgi:hypothetical protein
MPTGRDDVRSRGKIGSRRSSVKVTRLTRNGLRPSTSLHFRRVVSPILIGSHFPILPVAARITSSHQKYCSRRGSIDKGHRLQVKHHVGVPLCCIGLRPNGHDRKHNYQKQDNQKEREAHRSASSVRGFLHNAAIRLLDNPAGPPDVCFEG